MTEKKMHSWIPTHTGGRFNLLKPRTEDVNILDIAHGLAQKVRYNGQGNTFYSVAQHAVICSIFVEPEFQKIALLHDANEAYLPDIPTPVKEVIRGWRELEEHLESFIFPAFGLDAKIPEEVKVIDHRLVLDEAKELGFDTQDWIYAEKYEPLGISITPLEWRPAEFLFISRFNLLFG